MASRALIGGDFNTTTWDLKSTWRLLSNHGRSLSDHDPIQVDIAL